VDRPFERGARGGDVDSCSLRRLLAAERRLPVLCLVRETGARLGLRLTCPLMPGDIGGAGGSGGLGRVGDRIAPPQCGRQRGASHSLSLSALSGSISRHAYQFFTTLILLAPATTLRPSVPTIARVSPSLLPCQDVCNGISVLVINAAVYSILIDRSFVFRSAPSHLGGGHDFIKIILNS
jgi:hypothetical protein